jgi:lipid-A-disaccharide synthase
VRPPIDLFLVTGEKSGDLYGAHLIDAFGASASLSGIGGEEMRKRNFKCLIPMEELQFMGFVDVLLHLPSLLQLLERTARLIMERGPDAVVTIDYPGFNLRLAGLLRKRGYQGKIFHYICPTVWAWRKKRISVMERLFDALFTILPFEQQCFRQTSLPVYFVGHPLVSTIAQHRYQPLKEEVDVALFPGSRTKEVKRNLPLLMKIAERLDREHGGLHFAISCSQPSFETILKKAINSARLTKTSIIHPNNRYDLMRQSRCAIAKSGTVTLELALHGVPTVVVYSLSTLDRVIAKQIFGIDLLYYSLPNILLQKEVFPEFFGPKFKEMNIVQAVSPLLMNGEYREVYREHCRQLTALLGPMNAHQITAEHIKNFLNR